MKCQARCLHAAERIAWLLVEQFAQQIAWQICCSDFSAGIGQMRTRRCPMPVDSIHAYGYHLYGFGEIWGDKPTYLYYGK